MKLFSLIFFLVISAQTAFGGCGSATCPLHYHRYLTTGLLQLKLNHEYINQDRIFVGTTPSQVGAIRYLHDEVQTINKISIFQAQLGITERVGLRLDVPMIARNHRHIHHHAGEDHWENWNFSGMGDLEIGGHYVLLLPESESGAYVEPRCRVEASNGTHNGSEC